MSDSRARNRTVCAVSLVLASLSLLVVTPIAAPYIADTDAHLDRVAATGAAYNASQLVYLIGAMVLVPGLFGVIRMVRGRHGAVAQIGAGLLVMGAIGSSGFYWLGVIESVAAEPGRDRAAMVGLLTDAETGPWSLVGGVIFFVGVTLGRVLLAVGLLLRRVVPVWVPITMLLAVVVYFLGRHMVFELVSDVFLLVAFTGIALRMARIPADDWGRWQPIPDTDAAGHGAAGDSHAAPGEQPPART